MSARALTENSDITCIATKQAYVPLNPPQCRNNVEGSKICDCTGAIVQGRMREPTQGTQAIINGHHDHILLSRQSRKVIGIFMPAGIATAVNPKHNRQGSVGTFGSGHVEVQTIFSPNSGVTLNTTNTARLLRTDYGLFPTR